MQLSMQERATSQASKPCAQGKLRGMILLHTYACITPKSGQHTGARYRASCKSLATSKLIRQPKMLFHHEDNLKRLSDPTEVAKLDPIHALRHWAPQGSVKLAAGDIIRPQQVLLCAGTDWRSTESDLYPVPRGVGILRSLQDIALYGTASSVLYRRLCAPVSQAPEASFFTYTHSQAYDCVGRILVIYHTPLRHGRKRKTENRVNRNDGRQRGRVLRTVEQYQRVAVAHLAAQFADLPCKASEFCDFPALHSANSTMLGLLFKACFVQQQYVIPFRDCCSWSLQ
ncbi:hypothetical protein V8C42DRAFT_265511 [Trichoderma barbatum]